MTDPASDAATREAVAQALAEGGLDASFEEEVLQMIGRPRSEWRTCCGSLCDPCVLELHRAADRALRRKRARAEGARRREGDRG